MKSLKSNNSSPRKYKKRKSNESSNSDPSVEGLTPCNSLQGTSSTGVSRSNSPISDSSSNGTNILTQVTNSNIPRLTCGMLIDKILSEKRIALLNSPQVCKVLHAASLPPSNGKLDNENERGTSTNNGK